MPQSSSSPALNVRQRGIIALAATLSACASALLLFGLQTFSILETTADWQLRALLLLAGAVAAALALRPLLGRSIDPAIGLTHAVAMLLVVASFALLGALIRSVFRSDFWLLNASLLFGLAHGLVWCHWSTRRAPWIVWSTLAGLAAYMLVERWNLAGLRTTSYGLNRVLAGVAIGLAWSLLCAPALFFMTGRFDGDKLRSLREDAAYREEMRLRLPRPLGALALFALGALLLIAGWRQGIQSCGWIDRLVGRSGCYQVLTMSHGSIQDLAVSEDGLRLAALDLRLLDIIDLASGETVVTINLPEDAHADQIALSPNNQLAAITVSRFNGDDAVMVYRLDDGILARTIPYPGFTFNAPAFSLDGETILLNSNVWRVADGADLGPLAPSDRARYRLNEPSYSHDIISPDGALTAKVTGKGIELRRATDEDTRGPVEHLLPIKNVLGTDNEGIFSSDGALLGVSYESPQDTNTIEVWSVSDEKLLLTLKHYDKIFQPKLAFTPDNRTLIVNNDRQLEFYRLK